MCRGWADSSIIDQIKLSLLARKNSYSSVFDYVRKWPLLSVPQLLPINNYISDDSGELSYPSGYPPNTFLENLSSISIRNVSVLNIVGKTDNPNTITSIQVKPDSSSLPKWEHGFPVKFTRGLGDSTVPEANATLAGVDNKTIQSDHQSLPTNAWPEISKFILGEQKPSLVPVFVPETTLVIAAHSPVDIQVIAPNGEKIGKDFSLNQEINQISHAFYSGFNDPELEFVTIPNPVAGEYKIITQGTGSGAYGIEADYASGDIKSSEFTANTVPGKSEELDINFDPNADIKIFPTDNTVPTTTAEVSGRQGLNGWYLEDATVSLFAIDNDSGVFKTEYSLDNGNFWIQYDASFTLSEGKNTVLFRSEDFMGNMEDVKSIPVNVDKTPPEAKISFDPQSKGLDISGTDNLSEVSVVQLDKSATLSDEAGNTLKINFSELNQHGKEIKVKVKNLSYNSGQVVAVGDNSLKYEWSLDKNKLLKALEQKIDVKGQFSVQAKYEKGETKIGKQKFPGLILLDVTTKSGKFYYGSEPKNI